MSTMAYAYMAYTMHSASSMRAQVAAQRFQGQALYIDTAMANAESQQRQFQQNLRQATHNHETSLDMAYWPLAMSPSTLALQFAHEPRRPLLALFVPPPEVKAGPNLESYSTQLNAFVQTHLSDVRGGVSFQTGYWKAGHDLTNRAVAQLQAHAPDQPMVLLSFALLPDDKVQLRFAYLAGPGGLPARVRDLSRDPIPLGDLMRADERERAAAARRAGEALLAADLSAREVDDLLGPGLVRSQLIERAERALADAGAAPEVLAQVARLYAVGESGLAQAREALVAALQLALLMASDAHNLLSWGLPPRLPHLLADLRVTLPDPAGPFLDDALEGYRTLFSFPSVADLPAVQIARLRLGPAGNGAGPAEDTMLEALIGWAVRAQLRPPASVGGGMEMLHRRAGPADAGFAETLGLKLEEAGDATGARDLYALADTLRGRRSKALTHQPDGDAR